MDDIRKYLALIIVISAALLLSIIAVYSGNDSVTQINPDTDLPLWALPMGVVVLLIIFKGVDDINQPLVAVGAVAFAIVSVTLLFAPIENIKWYYPFTIPAAIFFFFYDKD